MLLQTLLNLYGKAAHKDRLFARVVLYADDSASLLVVPLLATISRNIDIRINTRLELGYDSIEHLYRLGAEGIETSLQAVYTDRTHIVTPGTCCSCRSVQCDAKCFYKVCMCACVYVQCMYECGHGPWLLAVWKRFDLLITQ